MTQLNELSRSRVIRVRSEWILLTLVFLVLAAGAAYAVYLGDTLRFFPDERDYRELAVNLARQRIYSLDGEHPSAYRPPGYPLVLGGLSLVGAGTVHFRLFNFAALGLSLVWIYLLLKEQASSRAAVIGALLAAGYPLAFYTAGTLYPQTLATLLLLLTVLLLSYSRKGGRFEAGCLILGGISFGWLVLTVPTFVLALPVLVVWWLYLPPKRSPRGLLLFLLPVFLLIAGWSVRNYRVFGDFVFVSTNSGENLLLGNFENTTPNAGRSADFSRYEAEAASLGEVARDRYYYAQAFNYILNNKQRTIQLYILKVLNYFNYRNDLVTVEESSRLKDYAMMLTYVPLLALFLVRLLLLKKMKPSPIELLLGGLYLFSALYSAVFFTRIRFRLPYDMLLIMSVSIFLDRLLRVKPVKAFRWIALAVMLAGCNLPVAPQATVTAPILSPSPTLPAPTQAVAATPSSIPASPVFPSAVPATLTSSPTQPAQADILPAATQTPLPQIVPFHGVLIDNPKIERAWSLLAEAGADWTRYHYFRWDAIEPARTDPPTYRWSAVDEQSLQRGASAGVDVIAITLYTPFWAQKYPGYPCGPVSEASLAAFAEYMNALVSRYSQPPYNIRYWEIGNEPDIDHLLVPSNSGFGCWGEKDDPYYGGAYYGEMLKVVYPQIKLADPNAQVLVGGLLMDCDPVNPPEAIPGLGQARDCSPSRFLEGILQNGGGPYFDGVSFHAYDYYGGTFGVYGNSNWHSSWQTGPVLIAKTHYLRDLLNQYGFPDKQLLNTELALLCGRTGNDSMCWSDDFALTKANYLAQAYAAAAAEGLRANVWYSLLGWRGSGLVNTAYTPLPAYQAFQFSAQLLEGAVYEGEVEDFPGVKGYAFQKDGVRYWLLWSVESEGSAISLAAAPAAVYDALGNPLPASQTQSVTLAPLYVELQN